MEKYTNSFLITFSILVVGLSIGYAGHQIHNGLTNFRNFDRSVVMKGLSEQDVEADLVLWSVAYTKTGDDLNILQDKMDVHEKTIKDFFKKYQIQASEVTTQQVRVQDKLAQGYNQNTRGGRYILTQSYLVRSINTEAVSVAAENMSELIRQGVVFAQNAYMAPTYLYTKLNEIKPSMIADATQNAREAAAQFANNSGQKVGGIKRASQGVFQILPRDKTYAIPESQ